jgi:sigma-B regulation protein RsbU (phosphoserine phosphatase)
LHTEFISSLEASGDLYDIHVLHDDVVFVTIGDVSGKGMGAALLMSNVLACLRMMYDIDKPIAEIVTLVSAQLNAATDPGMFATLFVGKLHLPSHRLEYVNAGHCFPFLVHRDGRSEQLDATGIPVGLIAGYPYESQVTNLEPGSLLALYTDGVVEAGVGDQLYGEERVLEHVCGRSDLSLSTVGGSLIDDVERFLQGRRPADDIALLLLRRDA